MSTLLREAHRTILKHLQLDHRRMEVEDVYSLERSAEGTLGWDPETKKNDPRQSAFDQIEP